MTKSDLRFKYKNLREQILDSELEENSLAIANNVLKMNIWNHQYYHIFLPITAQKEVNTEYILHLLSGKDKEIVVSKSDFQTVEMSHYLLTDSTKIALNSHGIPEPVDGLEVPVSKIDVVFVPLLGYNKVGNRIGYGKGFYDKFLSRCKPEILKIGLSFFEPESEVFESYKSDIKLDFCVTPTTIWEF